MQDGGAWRIRSVVRSDGIGRDQNVSRGPWRRVWSDSIVVRLRSSTHSTDQNQRSAAALPPSTANVGVWQQSVQVHWEHKCGLLVHLGGFTKVRVHPQRQSRRVAMGLTTKFQRLCSEASGCCSTSGTADDWHR